MKNGCGGFGGNYRPRASGDGARWLEYCPADADIHRQPDGSRASGDLVLLIAHTPGIDSGYALSSALPENKPKSLSFTDLG